MAAVTFGSSIAERRQSYCEIVSQVYSRYRFGADEMIGFTLAAYDPDSLMSTLPRLGPLELVGQYVNSFTPYLVTNSGHVRSLETDSSDWTQLQQHSNRGGDRSYFFPSQRRHVCLWRDTHPGPSIFRIRLDQDELAEEVSHEFLEPDVVFEPMDYAQTLYMDYDFSVSTKRSGVTVYGLGRNQYYSAVTNFMPWAGAISTQHNVVAMAARDRVEIDNMTSPGNFSKVPESANIEHIIDAEPSGNVFYFARCLRFTTRGTISLLRMDLRESWSKLELVSATSAAVRNQAMSMCSYNSGRSVLVMSGDSCILHYDTVSSKWSELFDEVPGNATLMWILDSV